MPYLSISLDRGTLQEQDSLESLWLGNSLCSTLSIVNLDSGFFLEGLKPSCTHGSLSKIKETSVDEVTEWGLGV
jgi:hypothetical protein